MKKLFLSFAVIILHLALVSEMKAQSSFNYKKYLFDSLTTLSIYVDSIDRSSGYVIINGGDSRCPLDPFNIYWGDGTSEDGFFTFSHTYSATTTNYIVKIIANYSSGWKDTAEVLVRFLAPEISPITLNPDLAVYIPSSNITLGSHYYSPPTGLTYFDDSFFQTISRSTMEYILSIAASIQWDFVNSNAYQYNNKFEQYMLRDPNFGGAYSLWFTDPVSFGVGDNNFAGTIGYSTFFHEMGHNLTLNTPADYYYGGKIDGNANAIFSETMAQIFQHATGYEMVNHYLDYGLSEDLMIEIKQSIIESIKLVREFYEAYLSSGKLYAS